MEARGGGGTVVARGGGGTVVARGGGGTLEARGGGGTVVARGGSGTLEARGFVRIRPGCAFKSKFYCGFNESTERKLSAHSQFFGDALAVVIALVKRVFGGDFSIPAAKAWLVVA